jgi:cytochrome d ubiquinol oxidase subunit I
MLTKNGVSSSVGVTSIVISLVIFVLLYGVLATVDLMLMLKYSRQQLPPAHTDADADAPVPAVQY